MKAFVLAVLGLLFSCGLAFASQKGYDIIYDKYEDVSAMAGPLVEKKWSQGIKIHAGYVWKGREFTKPDAYYLLFSASNRGILQGMAWQGQIEEMPCLTAKGERFKGHLNAFEYSDATEGTMQGVVGLSNLSALLFGGVFLPSGGYASLDQTIMVGLTPNDFAKAIEGPFECRLGQREHRFDGHALETLRQVAEHAKHYGQH